MGFGSALRLPGSCLSSCLCVRSGGDLILVGLVLVALVEKRHEVLEWMTAGVGILAGGSDFQAWVIGVGLLQLGLACGFWAYP